MTVNHTRNRARSLRASQTEAEGILWSRLRGNRLDGFKWRRQTPLGPFFADFACFEARLVVELDGSQHGRRVAHDIERDRWIESHGWRVLRFWNVEVFQNLEGVCETIARTCHERRQAARLG